MDTPFDANYKGTCMYIICCAGLYDNCFIIYITMKVLVLPRVIRCVPKYLEDKASSANDAIYSTPEKVLLAWLNFHYENQKKRLLRGKGVCVCVTYIPYSTK